jgi:hypothetical protein
MVKVKIRKDKEVSTKHLNKRLHGLRLSNTNPTKTREVPVHGKQYLLLPCFSGITPCLTSSGAGTAYQTWSNPTKSREVPVHCKQCLLHYWPDME